MEPGAITWQMTLQYVGGVCLVVSLGLFWAMARGREPDYKQAFVAIWMFTLPITGVWVGVPLLLLLLHPVWLLAVIPAIAVWWNWPKVRRLLRG